MRRINLYVFVVFLSPILALVGCPAGDAQKQAPTKQSQAKETPSNEPASDEAVKQSPQAESQTTQQSTDQSKKPAPPVEQGRAPAAEEKLSEIFKGWTKPKLAIVISANQDGYIEPCGCIGLENQKGGLSRRATFLKELRDKGWPLVLVDGGGLIRGYGPQAVLKYRTMIDTLSKMGYHGLAFGTKDLRLPVSDLLVDVVEEKNPFVVANVSLSGDLADKLTPDFREVEVAGVKIGITSILGKKYQDEVGSDEIAFQDPVAALTRVVPKMKAKCDKLILLSHATPEETQELAKKFTEFDVVVTAGGATEPPTTASRTPGKQQLIIDIGHKGSYVGVVGLFDDAKMPWRYERVPLDHRFKDSPEGDAMMAEYQRQLKVIGLTGLGLKPMRHPSGSTFVGTDTCSDCHSTAHEIWKKTPHAHATYAITNPPERLEPARHFDPECLSCHVTGWEPQKFYPFAGGYLDLEKSKQLHDVGCENCHGPGSAHVAAEEEEADDATLQKFREQMRISKKTMKDSFERGCNKCHDQDNDPNFEFDKYWAKVKHYGKD
jgi:hypothetical protein